MMYVSLELLESDDPVRGPIENVVLVQSLGTVIAAELGDHHDLEHAIAVKIANHKRRRLVRVGTVKA